MSVPAQDIRDQMLKGGMVPKLVKLLEVPAFRAKTLRLLYHLSADDRCKSMLTYTGAVPILMGLVINFPQDMLAKELAALMVNISYNPKNCELMVNNKGLNLLMDRLADKRDPLLLKIIRNLSLWTFNMQEVRPDRTYVHMPASQDVSHHLAFNFPAVGGGEPRDAVPVPRAVVPAHQGVPGDHRRGGQARPARRGAPAAILLENVFAAALNIRPSMPQGVRVPGEHDSVRPAGHQQLGEAAAGPRAAEHLHQDAGAGHGEQRPAAGDRDDHRCGRLGHAGR